jgi:cell pole-organizing protein PopZ
MEEILSSIRRIIADEEAEEGHPDDDDLGAAEAQAEALNEDADALAEAAEDDDQDDVLELTRVVRDSGEVVDLKSEGGAPPASGPPLAAAAAYQDDEEVEHAPLDGAPDEEPVATQPEPYEQEDTSAVQTKTATMGPELVSASAASAATGAFAKLSEAFQRTPPEESVAESSGRTIEQFVEDMIRPLLKEWMDENLPPIVERLVQKEIQKIARRAELM